MSWHSELETLTDSEIPPAPKTTALPTDSKARKGVPLFSGLDRYFPDALAEVARLSKLGNDKHNPNQPLHWSREKSSDHADCIRRHLLDAHEEMFETPCGAIVGIAIDHDDNVLHAVKVAWRALAHAQLAIESRRRVDE